MDEMGTARVLDAALQISICNGSATVDEVAIATGFDPADVAGALAQLARAGQLIARLGGSYARPITREIRLPGESWVSEIRQFVPAALMRARA